MSPSSPVKQQPVKRQDTIEGFRLLADTIPTLCWMADASGSIYWYNKRWYEYTGIPAGTTDGEEWEAAHDASDHAHIVEKWKVALKTGEPFDMVVSLRGADGIYRPFLSHIVPSKDDEGNITGWLGIKNDISDLQAADRALRDREEQLKTLTEAMPQMAFQANAKGEVTYYNQRWYEYVGSVRDTLGWGWKDMPLHHPDDLQKTIDRWKESIETGKDYEIEYRLRRHDGRYRWHLGRAVAVKDEKGEITSWIGTNTDIHEQKRQSQVQDFLLQATKELSKSLEYKETLQTITKLCVPAVADWCSVDLIGDEGTVEQVAVEHADPAKLELAKEFRVRNPVDVEHDTTGVAAVAKSGQTEFYPHIDDSLLESSIDDSETLAFIKSLEIKSMIIVPISIKGKTKGAMTFVSSKSGDYYNKYDLAVAEELASRVSLAITNALLFKEVQAELAHTQQLEQELKEEKATLEIRVKSRTKQLEQTNRGLEAEVERRKEVEVELNRSNQELQDFAYVASHDLQEPLRKIQAFGDILANEYGDRLGDGSEYLSRMHAAASRMSQLIDDLLVFSRVTTSPPIPRRIDLNQMVSEVLSDLENRINKSGGRVEVGDLPTVKADATQMRQLFQNLIANALKFHKPDEAPVVKVKSSIDENEPSMHIITVEDSGIGFDEKYADRIFGVFQRLHGRGSYEGTGIGLAVCRKIVERYGGTITADGRPGQGAKFTIKFPKAA